VERPARLRDIGRTVTPGSRDGKPIAIVLGAAPVLAHATTTPGETATAGTLDGVTAPAGWQVSVSGADLFNGNGHPAVDATARPCPTVVRGCPTAPDPTLTLTLDSGNLQFGIESITALPAADGNLHVDVVLDVDDATGSGGGWVISQDGPQAVQVLRVQVGCREGSGCVPAPTEDPTAGDAGHLLFAAQRNTGMGPQRVEVVFETAAVLSHWSLSIAPPQGR
jgi:hypothetical protein